jgi:DsbC/DsbD-like thiol-disulfide interchange protein
MSNRSLKALILPAIAVVGACVLQTDEAIAQTASQWDADSRSAVRLVSAASVTESNVNYLRAGVEVRLQPGSKTYWRYPGDSGIPPRFDFGGSDNVRSVHLLWPAPERFSDSVGYSIGYKESVVFPVRIVPRDEKKPVILRVKMDYAVCDTLCVPAKGKAELQLSSGDNTSNAILAAAEARVPKPTPLGAGQTLTIRSVHRMLDSLRGKVVVDVASQNSSNVDLFAEGPTPTWALPLPERIAIPANGLNRFGLELDGLPPGATPKGATLKFTAVTSGQAIEVEYRLE